VESVCYLSYGCSAEGEVELLLGGFQGFYEGLKLIF
jgi:hypothetical protein